MLDPSGKSAVLQMQIRYYIGVDSFLTRPTAVPHDGHTHLKRGRGGGSVGTYLV